MSLGLNFSIVTNELLSVACFFPGQNHWAPDPVLGLGTIACFTLKNWVLSRWRGGARCSSLWLQFALGMIPDPLPWSKAANWNPGILTSATTRVHITLCVWLLDRRKSLSLRCIFLSNRQVGVGCEMLMSCSSPENGHVSGSKGWWVVRKPWLYQYGVEYFSH